MAFPNHPLGQQGRDSVESILSGHLAGIAITHSPPPQRQQTRQRTQSWHCEFVGHTGSSIVTWMLHQLGWHASADVDHFAEPVGIRELNDRCLGEGTLDVEAARDELAKLPTPWAIKDPRFARTMPHWLPLLEPYAPALLYLSRDAEKVRASFERRGQRADAVDEKVERCEAIFESWPWWRMEVEFDELSRVVGAFDPGRRGEQGHGRGDGAD